jgi:hypothetical protein
MSSFSLPSTQPTTLRSCAPRRSSLIAYHFHLYNRHIERSSKTLQTKWDLKGKSALALSFRRSCMPVITRRWGVTRRVVWCIAITTSLIARAHSPQVVHFVPPTSTCRRYLLTRALISTMCIPTPSTTTLYTFRCREACCVLGIETCKAFQWKEIPATPPSNGYANGGCFYGSSTTLPSACAGPGTPDVSLVVFARSASPRLSAYACLSTFVALTCSRTRPGAILQAERVGFCPYLETESTFRFGNARELTREHWCSAHSLGGAQHHWLTHTRVRDQHHRFYARIT